MFSFGAISDVQRNCRDMTRSSLPYAPHRVVPVVSVSHHKEALVRTKKLTLAGLLTKFQASLWISLVFPIFYLFLSLDLSFHVAFHYHISPVSSALRQFLSLCFLLLTLTALRVIGGL